MSVFGRDFHKTKWVSFLIKDEKYNEIWGKMSVTLSKNEFHSKPVYNEKYLKSTIKSYNRKINTNFHNDEIPKQAS